MKAAGITYLGIKHHQTTTLFRRAVRVANRYGTLIIVTGISAREDKSEAWKGLETTYTKVSL